MKGTKLPVINRSINAVPVWYHNTGEDFPTSEQRSEYVVHQLARSVDYSPRMTYQISKIPFDDFSEQRMNFVKHSVTNPQFIRRRDQIQLSKMPIISSTNYGDDYKNKESVKSSPFRPTGSQLEFVFKNKENLSEPIASIYREDYQKKDNQSPPKKAVTFIDNHQSPTDYQINFQKKPPTRVFLPYPVYKMPKVPFACDTSYNLAFIKHPYSKEGLIAPLKSNLTFTDDSAKDFRSTYKADYVKKKRDTSNDELNIYTNESSLMQSVPHTNWYDTAPSEEFNDYRRHVFYQT